MSQINPPIEFGPSTSDDIERDRELRDKCRWASIDSVERLCLEHELEMHTNEKMLDINDRLARNLQAFNAELYTHGIRRWCFNSTYMVTAPGVHQKRAKEYGIYVPIWAVSAHFGMPGACGNTHQKQLSRRIHNYFPVAHEAKIIEINHENGAYSIYPFDDAPFELTPEIIYWIRK